MKKRIEILYDVINNQYLGVKYYPYEIDSYISMFKQFVDNEELYNLYTYNREKRDGLNYHTTIFSVPEYNVKRDVLNNYIGKEVTIEILGLGKVERGENNAFYLIVNSIELNKLTNKDLHITLGFTKKDIFLPKGIETMVLKM